MAKPNHAKSITDFLPLDRTVSVSGLNYMKSMMEGDFPAAPISETKVPRGFTSTTLEFKVNITRPIPMSMEVDIIGTATHAGRSTGVAWGEIIGTENEKLYATGSTTCMVIKVP